MDGITLSELRTKLVPRIDGRLALTPDLLDCDRLSDDWQSLFGTDTLLLANATVQVDAAGNVVIAAKAEVFRIEDLPVVVTFFVSTDPTGSADDALQCLIVPDSFPEAWRLDGLYPDMPGYLDYAPARIVLGRQPSFLRDTIFRKSTLAYSSFDFSADDGRDLAPLRASLKDAPQLDGRPLKAGINFTATLECVGEIWTDIRDLLKPVGGLDRMDAFGVISNDGGPLISLAHSLVDPKTGHGHGPGLSVTGAGAFSLSLKEVRLTSGLDEWGLMPGLSLRTAIESGDVALDLDIGFNAGSPTAWIRGSFGGKPLTLPQLEKALGLGGLAAQLPGPLESFGGLGLARMEADLTLSPLHLDRLAFVITTEHPWTIVEKIISVQPVFAFELSRGGDTTETALEITGDWLLGSTRFETFVSPEDGQFAAYMATGQSLDVGAVLERFLPGVEHPDCALLDLDLYGNYKEGSVGFDVETHGGWSFHLGGTELSIGDIAISGEYDDGDFRGKLLGSLGVAGWLAKVDVELQEQLSIEVRLPEVNITELLDEFLAFVGIPDELPDFDIKDLDIRVVPSTGAFHISGESDSEIDLFPGFKFQLKRFSAGREIAGGKAKVSAKMQWLLHLGPADAAIAVALSADYSGTEDDADAVTTEWAFEGLVVDQKIPVGHMLDALEHLVGLDYPLPTSGLEIAELYIAFNIGAVQRYFVVSCALTNGARQYGKFSVVASRTLADDPEHDPDWDYTLNFEADLDIGMADLPLVGPQLDEVADMKLHALQMTIASRAFTRDEVTQIRTLLPSRAVRPTDDELTKGTNFAVQATLGGTSPKLRVPVALTGPPTRPIGGTERERAAATTAAASPPRPKQQIDTTKWFPVNKAFGAVDIERIGLRFQNSTLTILLDTELNLQALHIGLLGLGLSSPLDSFHPSVSLEGITIEYDQGAVTVSGGLMRTPDGGFEGVARLATAKFALTAMGEYLTINGHPSLFLFGVLEAPLGGPPCCFVRGVAAGLGFNSTLNLPSAENVGDFALIRAAMPGSNPTGSGSNLMDVLRTMGDDIRPQLGSEWLAAGIRFSSFEIVQSVALLTVTLDSKPRINLLGLSRLSVPPMSPSPIAVVEIGLIASIDPDAGLLAVQGQLTRNSYILSHDCRPTGGFAFYTWFSGPHEGDFVLSIGGYHPHFPVPAHYPQVPRITMEWRLSDNLEIKGTSYFALVPNMVMAGASMEAVFEMGDLRAWFIARYDVLISWKPFHYSIGLSIAVGASLRINLLFTSITLSVQVGADLVLHGPPFGGEATVDISVMSFSISFGQSRPSKTPISWQEFKQSFLPPSGSTGVAALASPEPTLKIPAIPTNSICTVQVVDGLVRDLTKQESYKGPLQWIANPERFAISTSSLIPSKAATLNGTDQPGQWSQAFGVGPAAIDNDAFSSIHHVRFEKHNHVTGHFESFAGLVATPITRNVPAALWRHVLGSEPEMGGRAVIENTFGGFLIRPPAIEPDATCAIDVAKLLFENEPIKSFDWSQPAKPAAVVASHSVADEKLVFSVPGGAAVENHDFVLAGLLDPATATRRNGIVAALRRQGAAVDPAIDLTRSGHVTLADWPSVCSLGAEVA